MGIAYTNRETVAAALAYNETARSADAIDRAIQSASRSIEGQMHRRFHPTIATRAFQRVPGRRLWLEDSEVISVTSLSIDGTAVTSNVSAPNDSGYTLSPNSGPPFTSIDFPNGPLLSTEGDLLLTGVFGYADNQIAAGSTATAVTTTTQTTVDVTDGSLTGVGDLLSLDTERVQVTGRAWTSTAQAATLTAQASAVTLTVILGSAWHVGEMLLIDAERILIVDIAGNNLIVKRAQGGSVLAAHTAATVYVSRTLTILRAQVGSTAATHLTALAITKLDPPAIVKELAVAEAINSLLQEASGYSRTIGSGDNVRNASGGGLDDLRATAYARVGRKARSVAI